MIIDLLICGGTIDKTYFPERELKIKEYKIKNSFDKVYFPKREVFDFDKTHISEMIKQARISNKNIKVKFLFHKDSLDMDNQDRKEILNACQKSSNQRILIMHGASTMIESARVIADENLLGKTIVFFGAMLPYELAKSDALFNFGFALSACQTLNSGVYIAMNGIAKKYNKIKKDEKRAIFVDI